MNWQTFVTTASSYVIGPFGIAAFGALMGWAGLHVPIEHSWRKPGWTLAGGVLTFSSAWAVTYFMGG
jgi:hypothetical protein